VSSSRKITGELLIYSLKNVENFFLAIMSSAVIASEILGPDKNSSLSPS
jgi:hypothetical protein